jgi:hypothetical protein
MELLRAIEEQITTHKREYHTEVDRQIAICHTTIETVNETLKRESQEIISQKESLLEQKTVFEREYRNKLKDLVSEDQIAYNLSLIPKVLSREKELKDLPSNLHPLVNIYARIQHCNQRGLEAQRKFRTIQQEQQDRLASIVPTLKPPYEARLVDLLKQRRDALSTYYQETEVEINVIERGTPC